MFNCKSPPISHDTTGLFADVNCVAIMTSLDIDRRVRCWTCKTNGVDRFFSGKDERQLHENAMHNDNTISIAFCSGNSIGESCKSNPRETYFDFINWQLVIDV